MISGYSKMYATVTAADSNSCRNNQKRSSSLTVDAAAGLEFV
jgi:hypothetical protein